MPKANASIKKIKQALIDAHGIISIAAKALGIDRRTIYRKLQDSKELQEVQRQCDEHINDLAESKLMKAITEDKAWAIALRLRTKAKHRGYTTQTDLNNLNSPVSDVNVKFEVVPNASNPENN